MNSLSDIEFCKWHIKKWEKKKTKLKIYPELSLTEGEKVIAGPLPVFIKKNPSNKTSAMNRYGYAYSATDTIVTNKRIALGYVAILSGKEVFGEHNYWFPQIKEIPKTKSKIGILGKVIVRDIILDKIEVGKDMYGEFVRAEFKYSLSKNETFIYFQSRKVKDLIFL
ncbi:MAG: hypothetical protein ABH983_05680 [Candidatus Micrarchaeota archaeon]|nr:hypothetical protein [Candidatus Micrarchaeota archaeon]